MPVRGGGGSELRVTGQAAGLHGGPGGGGAPPATERPSSPTDGLEVLPGVGPKTASMLASCGVECVGDLLLHTPARYEDRTTVLQPDGLREGEPALVRGVIRRPRVGRRRGRGRGVVHADLVSEAGTLPVVWFNQTWIAGRLRGEPEVYLHGVVRRRPGTGVLQLVNPSVEPVDATEGEVLSIVPVYPGLASWRGRRLRRLVERALGALERLEDPVPPDILGKLGLPGLPEALRILHRPPVPGDPGERRRLLEDLHLRRTPAHRRLAFDELLALAGSVERLRERRRGQRAPLCADGKGPGPALPFELTPAQRRVVDEIRRDLASGRPMARLLQGDVGSGKTVVAALAAARVLRAGWQVAFMAPTELLAEQHHRTLAGLFRGTPWEPLLLTGSLDASSRRRVLGILAGGKPCLVVGTHALIQRAVSAPRLGLVVVDEQHRFGVAQRRALVEKGEAPHLLVMTATPIPRTLALVVYGDLDLSVIDELPPGRKPVRTVVRSRDGAGRLWEFAAREAREGGRVFVVYPSIGGAGGPGGESVEDNLPELRSRFPGLGVVAFHGRLGPGERRRVVEDFRAGRVRILVATTVVEVGVDVPEASVMIIESPERFGLSQLHQLRGRVGRGRRPSWCVLLVEDGRLGEAARRRLEVFRSTTDGFRLAEADLEIRGPGEVAGLRQWGADGLRHARLPADLDLLRVSRDVAGELAARGQLDAVLEGLAGHLRGAWEAGRD